MDELNSRLPHPLISVLPLAVLVAMIVLILLHMPDDALSGASQLALIVATCICVAIAMVLYHVPWKTFEHAIQKTIGEAAVSILILLMIGVMSSTWMISGVVPTLIYYGVQFMSPQFFLPCACIISSLISVMTGTSWTTIATIGIALLGIGNALGIPAPYCAGAIISGAYFGDKMSPLSDTTILASSSAGVDIFSHIRYMMLTTMPAFLITLLIFTAMGLGFDADDSIHVHQYTEGLSRTFNISLWTLLVPVLTGVLIVKRVPSLIVLFLSAMMAGVMALILQPHILTEIAGDAELSRVGALTKGLVMTFYGPTAIETGSAELNDLVSTGGMAGMLNTIWLIVCAMCFGAAMVASGMIESITKVVISWVRSRVGLVASTASTGLFLNVATGDQFISIVLTVNMFKDVYKRQGYEARLVSRTAEDSATVTSVLVPWNTCGLTQSTVLGVATIAYLPYCFFNILSPLMTILVAAVGWKIRKKMRDEK